MWSKHLSHPDEDRLIGTLFTQLLPTLSLANGQKHEAAGLNRKDKVENTDGRGFAKGIRYVSGALNVLQERVGQHYSCGAQIIPGLLQFGDVPEIGSLIAPRPCVWEIGSRDTLISPKWADEALTRMGHAYKALGAEKELLVDRFEGGHEWSGRVGYGVMEKLLG